MHPTSKSRVVSSLDGRPLAPEVWAGLTSHALGSSRARGAAGTVWRKTFAWRPLAALAALALLAGCDPQVRGNGVYAERRIDPGPFAGVRMEDGVGAVVTIAPGLAPAATVTGDENLVEDHIKTSLEVEGAGSTAVTVLHVRVDPSDFVAIIPPRVVISQPVFSLVRARDRAAVELKRPAGASDVGGPLSVVLEGATLYARQYPTASAAVLLTEGSSALLAAAAVTGTVADSLLDNLGPCDVTTTASSTVRCE